MSPSELVTPLADRWTIADEAFAAFLGRRLNSTELLKLERERVRSRQADKRLRAEREYDAETTRLLAAIHGQEQLREAC